MNYRKKTIEIRRAMKELHDIPYSFPLLREMIERKQKERIKYYARIDYNLRVFGKSALKFDDIDYQPFNSIF
jgi:hypothetical protein